MKINISSEICQKCGKCCKGHPFIELTEKEVNLLEEQTGLTQDQFTCIKNKETGEYFFKFKKNGECVFLTKKNGNHSCSVYNARPKICRDYPSTSEQKETCYNKCKEFLTD
jgi:uncharacterized protein